MNIKQILLIAILIAFAVAFFQMGLHEFLTLKQIKMEQASIEAWVEAQPAVASIAYFLIYVAVTAVSLPGAAVMTLAGGAVFGFWWGF
ncbi:MAG TPA: pyridine nucleotide-disulfide oxidoreductase, partial [Gammaproteobacteria bacterium]|nr:pyridine nucleotide-disulfide oxidoreductase [Gammaproteobacteria bacterium]